MKFVSVREARANLSEFLELAQTEKVCVMNHGKPVAVMYGVHGKDIEDVLFENDPKEAELVRASERRGGSRPLKEVAAELGIPLKRARSARRVIRAPAKRAAKTSTKR